MPTFSFIGCTRKSYLENLTIDDTLIKKRVRLYIERCVSLKLVKKKKLVGRHNVHTFVKWLLKYFLKKCRSSHRRSSVKKLFLKILQYSQETPVLESLFSSEHCKIFWSTYFEERLRTAASENVHETSDYDETEKH